MGREIKFRAFDKLDSTMFFNHSVTLEISGTICLLDTTGEWLTLPKVQNRLILMQYTGLTDKNGKDIYEGDIIARRGMQNGYVEYNKGKWSIRHDEQNIEWRVDLHNQISIHLEIIGNVHQHPELLTPQS